MTRWEDLDPDRHVVAALDETDAVQGVRGDLIRSGSTDEKRNWSNAFADACARLVADALRSHPGLARLTVLPDPTGTAEPPTITYWERGEPKEKKVDVVAGDLIAGLQIAVSLKGVGFRDQRSLGFGKNITGRLYELENETRRLHEYRPQALVVALYFVPIGSVEDKKTGRTPSSFADIVTSVRRLCGRADPHRQDEWHRVDLGFVGLYSAGEVESFTMRHNDPSKRVPFTYDDRFERGVIRFFDVTDDPPFRGRPVVERTLSLHEMVDRIVVSRAGPSAAQMEWSEPEPESP